MALIREVVECLLHSPKDEIALTIDNFHEAICRPKVEDGAFIRFTPGTYDPSVARFAFEVKGVKFVRGRDDAVCLPKDEDDLIGVLGFARSHRFRELGYVVAEDAGRTECREAILKAVSDIERKRGLIDKFFNCRYVDFSFAQFDFEIVREKLSKLHYLGYTDYNNGRWRGVQNADAHGNVVGESICAMGLIESLDETSARDHLYAELSRDDYEKLLEATGGDDTIRSKLRASVRGWTRKKKVLLFLSRRMVKDLSCSLYDKENDRSFAELSERLEKAIRKWRRICEKEISDIETRRLMREWFNCGPLMT